MVPLCIGLKPKKLLVVTCWDVTALVSSEEHQVQVGEDEPKLPHGRPRSQGVPVPSVCLDLKVVHSKLRQVWLQRALPGPYDS